MTNFHESVTMGGTAAESERDTNSDVDRWSGVDVHVDDPGGTLRDVRSTLATVFETLTGLSAVAEADSAFDTDRMSPTDRLDLCRSLTTSRAIRAADTELFADTVADDGTSPRGDR